MAENFPFYNALESKSRINPCSCCGEKAGNIVSKINYIGLLDTDLVQCPHCALISVDPVPSTEETAKGCTLLYRFQQTETNKKKILRGFARSFRRGARFARTHLGKLKNKEHISILEIGAGDGYFSQGVISEFKDGHVTYIDIVNELGKHYKSHFPKHTALTGEFSEKLVGKRRFDLIIIRDLLEHLRDPNQFLLDAQKVLRPKGHLFIITPNGWEDAWSAYQYSAYRTPKELNRHPYILYLNHFHYFMPLTIKKLMEQNNFKIVKAFKYGLKRHRQGLGVKKLKMETMERPNLETFEEENASFLDHWKHNPNFLKGQPLHNNSFISKIYSAFTDREKEVVDFESSKGHEFFIMAQKN